MDLAAAFRLPVMASNGVRFASPEARPLYDVHDLHSSQDDAGAGGEAADGECRALSQAAGSHGAVVRRSAAGPRRHRSAGRAARVHAGESRLSLSRLSGAGRRVAVVVPAPARAGGRARSLSAVPRPRAGADRARTRSHRETRTRRLLPHRLGPRQFLPAAGHSGAGPRVGGQQRRLLRARHHGRRSGRAWICCSSASCPKNAASGRISIWICRAAIGASASFNTCTSATASSAPR